jgi:hypothetical protein
MAARWFQQFWFSLIHSPVFLEGNFSVGATGSVRNVKGSGIKAITKEATGLYRIDLDDTYYRYMTGGAGLVSPYSGSNVAIGSLSTGTLYMITVVGTSDWAAVGLPTNATAAVGQTFVATGTGSGSGYAQAVAPSTVNAIEVASNPQATVTDGKAPYLHILVMDKTDALVSPPENSTVGFWMILRNSSIAGKGE